MATFQEITAAVDLIKSISKNEFTQVLRDNDISRVYYHRLPTVISDSKQNLRDLITHQEDKLRSELKKIICDEPN